MANTGGNPLALRELPSVLTPGQLAGTEPLPPRLPVTERIERVFLDRARRLSEDAQTLLLVASADDSTRLATVLKAAETLGADVGALAELETVRPGRRRRRPAEAAAPAGAVGDVRGGAERRPAPRPWRRSPRPRP